MKKGIRIAELSAIIVCAALGIASSAQAQGQTSIASDRKENTMSFHAKGSFVPTLTPQPPDDKAAGSTLARLSIAKNWHGDLEATSEGQMVTATTEVKGSAAYVAIERVTGTLGGRHGSFVLQHMGTLDRGAPHLSVTAVPDSGTGGTRELQSPTSPSISHRTASILTNSITRCRRIEARLPCLPFNLVR